MGFQTHENGDITYREWAPNALRAYVIGDFSMLQSAFEYMTLLRSYLSRLLE